MDTDAINSKCGTSSDLNYTSNKDPSIKKLITKSKEEMMDFFDEYWESVIPK